MRCLSWFILAIFSSLQASPCYTAIGQELGISEVQGGPDLNDHEETDIASVSAMGDRSKMGHSDASQIPSYRPIVVYVLRSPGYNPGMFSIFSTVLGFLDFYEERGGSIQIDFEKKGVYYDKKKGPNWWTYYFEPIAFGKKTDRVIKITDEQQSSFANKALSQMSRERAHQLIEKYIVIKKPLRKKIDLFVKQHFKEQFVIGIHYRGTDKMSEAPRTPYEEVYRAIDQTGVENCKLFVATDEQAFLDAISLRYPGRIICLEAIRSTNGQAVHSSRKNGYQKGEEALLDCVLLSKTQLLIRTQSNLSACSALFNPTLPVQVLLGKDIEKDTSQDNFYAE